MPSMANASDTSLFVTSFEKGIGTLRWWFCVLDIYIYTDFLIIFLTINPNPDCQLFLWEETGEPGENPRLSAEC